MPEAPFKQQVNRLLQQQKLRDEEYEALQKLMHDALPVQKKRRRRRRFYALAVAAAVLLMVGTGFLLNVVRDGSSSSETQISAALYRVSEEVLVNHLHIRNLDLETDSYETLRDSFSQLDFGILESYYLAMEPLYLLGGRYCTLQGSIATQLVLSDYYGNTVTHYQAAYDEARFGPVPDLAANEFPLLFADRGVSVEIWQESGVLMARARTL